MARDSSVQDERSLASNGDEKAANGGNTELLGRRSYMKLAGTTAAATAVTGAAGAAGAADGDYEVVEARGQTVTLNDGDTYENKLIDLTTGGSFLIMIQGTDTTVRNIGFKGLYRGDAFMISIGSGATNGSVTIENVYAGDGSTKEGADFVHGAGFLFYHGATGCEITIERCNVQGWPNNAFYCSNTAKGGSVRFTDCFGKNNGVTTFRCAGSNDVIENCVAYNDETDYGAGWGGYTEQHGRPVWVWNGGTVTIRDSHFADGPYSYALVAGANGSPGRVDFQSGGIRGNIQRASGSTVSLGDDVTREPDLSIPDGVPTSAEEAASGGSQPSTDPADESDADDEGDARLPNVVVFDGSGTSDVTDYEFVVSDAVEPSTDEGATIDAAADVDDTRASGSVADYRDAWRFSGEIERLSLEGDASVRVNGVEVDPGRFDDVLENVLLVDGSPEDATRYEFAVDGAVQRSNDEGASIDDEDVVEDGSVHGSVADWKDAFRFSGELTDLTVDGPATVTVNGESVDPNDYGTELPHVLEVRGRGTPTSYEITVDGRIELAGDEEPADEVTTISGSTVQSSLTDGAQTYRFSGALTDVTFTDGEADISLDGEPIDPSDYGDHELLPHAVVIDGTGADGPSTYSFVVDGTVVKSDYRDASIDDEDVVEDRAVRGAVGNWLDAYWFDGDLEDFVLRGDATVDIQENARNQ